MKREEGRCVRAPPTVRLAPWSVSVLLVPRDSPGWGGENQERVDVVGIFGRSPEGAHAIY